MRLLIAISLLLMPIAPALAAPPSSCAGKFVGEWRHSGSGNRGSVKADGRALCSEHPACVQGTWTCSGDVLIYTNSLGTWNYTLAPDGRSMSTGTAVATRIGPVPAVARSRAPAPAAAAPASAPDVPLVNRAGATVREFVRKNVLPPDCEWTPDNRNHCKPPPKATCCGVRG